LRQRLLQRIFNLALILNIPRLHEQQRAALVVDDAYRFDHCQQGAVGTLIQAFLAVNFKILAVTDIFPIKNIL